MAGNKNFYGTGDDSADSFLGPISQKCIIPDSAVTSQRSNQWERLTRKTREFIKTAYKADAWLVKTKI